MSRSIAECGNFIWRYRQGQEDPMAFVSLLHQVGDYKILEVNSDGEMQEYSPDVYFNEMNKEITDAFGDLLTIRDADVNKLKELLDFLKDSLDNQLELFNLNFKDKDAYVSFDELEKDIEFMKKYCPRVWFFKMVNSMVKYIDSNPKDVYYFMGEV